MDRLPDIIQVVKDRALSQSPILTIFAILVAWIYKVCALYVLQMKNPS